MRIKHPFVSTKPDVVDDGLIKPGQWNAEHTAETEADSVILGRRVGETAGPVQELPVKVSTVSLLLDAFTGLFRFPRGTAAQRPTGPNVMAGDVRFNTDTGRLETYDGFTWGNIAIGEVAFCGALEWSFIPTEPSGWMFFTGSLGKVGSPTTHPRDDCQKLYELCWNMPVATFPMSDTSPRGGTALADWNGLRGISFPDWRGRTFAINETMGGSVSGNVLGMGAAGGFVDPAILYAIGGSKSQVLTAAQLAKHDHELSGVLTNISTASGSIPDGPWFGVAPPDTMTEEAGDDEAHNNVQPTVMLNCFVKL